MGETQKQVPSFDFNATDTKKLVPLEKESNYKIEANDKGWSLINKITGEKASGDYSKDGLEKLRSIVGDKLYNDVMSWLQKQEWFNALLSKATKGGSGTFTYTKNDLFYRERNKAADYATKAADAGGSLALADTEMSKKSKGNKKSQESSTDQEV